MMLLPDPFRGMGAWRKTMQSQKPGNSPGPGPKVVEKQSVAKERVVQRVHSWTVQNKMRGVLGRMSAGAASRILNSSLTEGCVRCSKDVRGYHERDEGEQVPQWRPRVPVCHRS